MYKVVVLIIMTKISNQLTQSLLKLLSRDVSLAQQFKFLNQIPTSLQRIKSL